MNAAAVLCAIAALAAGAPAVGPNICAHPPFRHLIWTADGRYILASGRAGNSVTLWDVSTGLPVFTYARAPAEPAPIFTLPCLGMPTYPPAP